MSAERTEPRTYGSWTRPRSEGMWGLAWGVTIAALVAIVISLLAFAFIGIWPGVVITGIEILILGPAAWRTDGRTGYERGILAMQFFVGWWKKETVGRSGVFSRLGTCRQPGLLAASRLHEGPSADGYRFAMIHTRKHHLYTVVLKCWPQGERAVDQDRIDDWVGAWGRLLASLGGDPDVVMISVTNNTMPETGQRLTAEVATLTRPDAPDMAKEVMDELAQMLPDDTVKSQAWCSISFRASTPDRRRHPEEQAVEIGRRLPGILTALADAGVTAQPMTANDVTAMVRAAWDPASEADLEALATRGEPHGIDWHDAGPVSHDSRRQQLWHDGVVSVSWEMSLAPEGNSDERVLQRLLAPNPLVPRKRVTLIHRPHAAGDAANIVTRDYRDAVAATRTAKGTESAHAVIREASTQQAREEQAHGHGVTRFSLLITVTELAGGDLPSIDAITKDLSEQSRLKIRRCHRYQAPAFAANLGVGVLLPEMASIPRAVSE